MHQLLVTGLSHRTANIKLRERLSFSREDCSCALRHFALDKAVREAVLLSTCNRVELYCLGSGGKAIPEGHLAKFMADYHRIPVEELEPVLYSHRGEDAVGHLFRVASGLDAMALGETQVLSQVKDAFATAQEHDSTGKYLNALFQRSFAVAKRIHNETRISETKISVPSVAVEFAADLFSSFNDKTLLQIGSGETGVLALTHFVERGVGKILLTSRTFQKAKEISAKFDAVSFPFENLREHMVKADIIVTAFASGGHVITAEMMESAIGARYGRPVFLLDLSVPRAVSPAVGKLENVFLYDVDDLRVVVDRNKEARQAELSRCLEIIEAEVDRFRAEVEVWQVEPLIKDLRGHAESLREAEWKRLKGRLEGVDPGVRDEIENMTKRLVNKILHPPMTAVRSGANEKGGFKIVELARRLLLPASWRAKRPPKDTS